MSRLPSVIDEEVALEERVADSNNEGFVDKRDLDASEWGEERERMENGRWQMKKGAAAGRHVSRRERPGWTGHREEWRGRGGFAQILLASRKAFRHFSGA